MPAREHELATYVTTGRGENLPSNGTTVVRNFFKEGFEEGTTDYFYTRDHLGSVREVVGSDGTTIASRRVYDPWGKPTESGSGALSDFGFTGHYFDRPTGESLTWYRGYDPNFGRWLSKDPIGLQGGLNLYGYVGNDPTNMIDPRGLAPYRPPGPLPDDVKQCAQTYKQETIQRSICCALQCAKHYGPTIQGGYCSERCEDLPFDPPYCPTE